MAKYKVLKELTVLTIAQAGPKDCAEFTKEWESMLRELSPGLFMFIPGGPLIKDKGYGLIDWAEHKPKRMQWLIDKGFLMAVARKCTYCQQEDLFVDRLVGHGKIRFRVQCACCGAAGPYETTPAGAYKRWNDFTICGGD